MSYVYSVWVLTTLPVISAHTYNIAHHFRKKGKKKKNLNNPIIRYTGWWTAMDATATQLFNHNQLLKTSRKEYVFSIFIIDFLDLKVSTRLDNGQIILVYYCIISLVNINYDNILFKCFEQILSKCCSAYSIGKHDCSLQYCP